MIHKFRSMIADAEKTTGPVWAQDDDPRVTRVGKYIRKLRIDELPQLWNVLKGEMSFVGPRPERDFFVKKLEAIIPFYRERFSVKPGLSGWAQVSYRYGASVDDAVEKLNYEKEDETLILSCDLLEGEKSKLNVWYAVEESTKHSKKYQYFITAWDET